MSAYPEEALRLFEQGTTLVAFTIREDGTTADPKVEKSSGFPILDTAALIQVLTWRYKPAIHNGHPVAVPWVVAVQFRLPDTSSVLYSTYELVPMDESDYPPESLAAREQGDSLVAVVLNERGSVMAVTLAKPSGYPRLDQAALSIAAGRWRYTSASRDGRPTKSAVLIDMRWTLPNATK